MRRDRPAELILGGVQLGLAYGAANRTGKPSRDAALRLVGRAVEGGIRAFDTARAYGDSEARLGEALTGYNFPAYTKLSPLDDLPPDASGERIAAAVDESIAVSCAMLKRETLDCLMLHRASHMTAFGGAIWRRLKDHLVAGSIRSLGVSVQSPGEAHAAIADRDVAHIQLPFNLLDWRWEKAGVIDAIRARSGLSVHVRSVFLQGLLAADDASLWPAIEGFSPQPVVDWLAATAENFRRESPADLALAFVRGQDWLDGVVVGMETEEQLAANLRLSTRPVLSTPDCAAIASARPLVPERLLDPAQWNRR